MYKVIDLNRPANIEAVCGVERHFGQSQAEYIENILNAMKEMGFVFICISKDMLFFNGAGGFFDPEGEFSAAIKMGALTTIGEN